MYQLDFLRYSIDNSCDLPKNVNGIDWKDMLLWADRQSIIGIVFEGIQRAGKELQISSDILYSWIGYVNLLEQQNRLLNKSSFELSEYLQNCGCNSCVLKGQAIAVMYPNPLRRTSGDIDVWTKGKNIREIIKIARNNNPGGKACYHHIDFGGFNNVEVEVHYRPTFMNNLIANRRLQQWIKEHEEEQFCHFVSLPDGGKIATPTWDFNVVFLLSHMYRHVIQSGLGLRQFIDYYYLLKSNDRHEIPNLHETLHQLGLYKFTCSVMWVLNQILGLEDKYLIAPIDEHRGCFLYKEIMQGGNFGQYDQRVGHRAGQYHKNIQRLKRDFRLLRYFPSECLWEPVFRIYHFFWRLAH